MIGAITRYPATWDDAARIVDDLSEITQSELASIGVRPCDTMKLVDSYLKAGEAEIFYEGDMPVCLIGVTHFSDSNAVQTWFLASRRFFELKHATVIPSRRVVREIAARHPGRPVYAFSWSKHPQVKRWFELLGFEQRSSGDNYLQFEFVEKRA